MPDYTCAVWKLGSGEILVSSKQNKLNKRKPNYCKLQNDYNKRSLKVIKLCGLW